MNGQKNKVIQRSIGWSLFSEVAAKFVTPVTNMLLARILTPDDFGVLAICNMLVSFVDIVTDAGFGKYLVQADMHSEEEKRRYADVAFWSNFGISVVAYLIIVRNRIKIAGLLGGEEYAAIICVASFQLILTSVSSIQTGLFRRGFEFKKLFAARFAVALVPLLIAVPLAYFTGSYWALVIGSLSGALINSVMLTILSPWKPRFYYSFALLKKMFHFSFWSLCEGLANWMIFWFDTFLVTKAYSAYYVGLYKNSANMVMSIMGMITASMSPVLLSVLSRVKDNRREYEELYLTIQRIMLYVIIPMGVGLFCYRDMVTYILFGSRWSEAADIIGAWGLMMTCSVIFYSFPAELYKSKGVPKILFFLQSSYLIFVIPVSLLAAGSGFWNFVYVRCFCIVEEIIISMVFINRYFSISPGKVFSNMKKPLFGSCTIIVTYKVFSIFTYTRLLEFLSMLFSAFAYLVILYLCFRDDLIRAKEKIQEVKL
ncbi:MAG: lipopolysaccharide biosynthesis protein [Lachnospiraceae bacterium]|nr:lipopolysaccharide biosynthesis protein [Lachnospiraceae bacterium]